MATASSDSDDSALIELLAPDGYYRYLGVTKPMAGAVPASAAEPSGNEAKKAASSSSSGSTAGNKNAATIDEDAIKKNYRKLSLKHHPDKAGGDADTFRVLNRAQRVLMNPKLRQQYDILGIDLDDDDEDHHQNSGNNNSPEDGDGKETSSSQGIVQEIASTVLSGVIQLGVRTLMMGSVSVLIVRFRLTLYPALAFLAYIIFRIIQQQSRLPGGSLYDTVPPSLIAAGLLLMSSSVFGGGGRDDDGDSNNPKWNTQFWMGEALVIGMFLYNSLTILQSLENRAIVLAVLAVVSLLLALWFRGNLWNYVVVLGLIVFVAIIVALAFPIMELLLEAILNEKLKKVGDKVRHHHQILQAHYEKKSNR